jgi:hypothetical protein
MLRQFLSGKFRLGKLVEIRPCYEKLFQVRSG